MNLAFPFKFGIEPTEILSIDLGGYDYAFSADYNTSFFRFISPTSSAISSYKCLLSHRAIMGGGAPGSAWVVLYTSDASGLVSTPVATSSFHMPGLDYGGGGWWNADTVETQPEYPELFTFSFGQDAVIPEGQIGYLRLWTTMGTLSCSFYVAFNGIKTKSSVNTSIPDFMFGYLENGDHSHRQAAGLLTFSDGSKLGSPWKQTNHWQRQYNYNQYLPFFWNPDEHSGVWNEQYPGTVSRLDWKQVAGGVINLPSKAVLYSASIKMFMPRLRTSIGYDGGQGVWNPTVWPSVMPIESLQAHIFKNRELISSSNVIPIYDNLKSEWFEKYGTAYDGTISNPDPWAKTDFVNFTFDALTLNKDEDYQLVVQSFFVTGSADVYIHEFLTQPGWMYDFQHDDATVNSHYYYEITGTEADPHSDNAYYCWRYDQYPGVHRLEGWDLATINELNPFRFPFVYGDLETYNGITYLTNMVIEEENDAAISLAVEWVYNNTELKRRHHGGVIDTLFPNFPPAVVPPDPFTPEMIFISGGDFLMGNSGVGDDASYMFTEELPQLLVYVDDYWIGKYEVTRGEYRKFIDAGGYSNSAYWSTAGWNFVVDYSMTLPNYWDELQSYLPATFTQEETHPVVGVSYYEAEAYCNWLSAVSGMNFHLPTEAQWEKAARWDPTANGGLGHSRIYPWGDDWDAEKCNWSSDSENPADHTALVGEYLSGASYYGCLDMAGNATEWCSGGYKSYPGGVPYFDFDPWQSFRGGAYTGYDPYYFRTSMRYGDYPFSGLYFSGFRLAKST